ncbi:MAG TPA: putative toxin-antitoxin system toxin component, PIN family, partial [Deltaproteobacteria bacterium]|nr:putative toxin-antitoxin system toxin component, PIN family [Deltaproteobacteria bacterium]
MRVVLDTNVILSGIFWNGPPFEILELWKKGRICLLVSREIIEEYQRAGQELAQKKPNINLTQILNLIVSSSEVYFPEPLFAPVCRDSKDDKFIACALTGNADFIV